MSKQHGRAQAFQRPDVKLGRVKLEIGIATESDRAELVALNMEYIAWVLAGIERDFGFTPDALLGMPLARYVDENVASLWSHAPPRGVFYLARVDGRCAGMGGLRPLADRTCEIKRIYVRADFRGSGAGAAIFDRLLADAQSFGYRTVRLDTAPFMQSARRIYEARGFEYRKPYPGVEVSALVHEQWRFMERRLAFNAPR